MKEARPQEMEAEGMAETIRAWGEYIERGPDWLFVRLASEKHLDQDVEELGRSLWKLSRCHFSQRMVLEMDDVAQVSIELLEQLAALSQRMHAQGGMLRLTGLHPGTSDAIDQLGLAEWLPHFEDREAAVMSFRPAQPR